MEHQNQEKKSKIDVYCEKEPGEVLEYKGLIDKTKIVRRYIHEEWNEIFRDNRLSKEGKELYQKKKRTRRKKFCGFKTKSWI